MANGVLLAVRLPWTRKPLPVVSLQVDGLEIAAVYVGSTRIRRDAAPVLAPIAAGLVWRGAERSGLCGRHARTRAASWLKAQGLLRHWQGGRDGRAQGRAASPVAMMRRWTLDHHERARIWSATAGWLRRYRRPLNRQGHHPQSQVAGRRCRSGRSTDVGAKRRLRG